LLLHFVHLFTGRARAWFCFAPPHGLVAFAFWFDTAACVAYRTPHDKVGTSAAHASYHTLADTTARLALRSRTFYPTACLPRARFPRTTADASALLLPPPLTFRYLLRMTPYAPCLPPRYYYLHFAAHTPAPARAFLHLPLPLVPFILHCAVYLSLCHSAVTLHIHCTRRLRSGHPTHIPSPPQCPSPLPYFDSHTVGTGFSPSYVPTYSLDGPVVGLSILHPGFTHASRRLGSARACRTLSRCACPPRVLPHAYTSYRRTRMPFTHTTPALPLALLIWCLRVAAHCAAALTYASRCRTTTHLFARFYTRWPHYAHWLRLTHIPPPPHLTPYPRTTSTRAFPLVNPHSDAISLRTRLPPLLPHTVPTLPHRAPRGTVGARLWVR